MDKARGEKNSVTSLTSRQSSAPGLACVFSVSLFAGGGACLRCTRRLTCPLLPSANLTPHVGSIRFGKAGGEAGRSTHDLADLTPTPNLPGQRQPFWWLEVLVGAALGSELGDQSLAYTARSCRPPPLRLAVPLQMETRNRINGGFRQVRYTRPIVDLLTADYTQTEEASHPRLQQVLDFVTLAAASPYGQRIDPAPRKKRPDPAKLVRKKMKRLVRHLGSINSKGTSNARSKASVAKLVPSNAIRYGNDAQMFVRLTWLFLQDNSTSDFSVVT
jgi:hypothetical protein